MVSHRCSLMEVYGSLSRSRPDLHKFITPLCLLVLSWLYHMPALLWKPDLLWGKFAVYWPRFNQVWQTVSHKNIWQQIKTNKDNFWKGKSWFWHKLRHTPRYSIRSSPIYPIFKLLLLGPQMWFWYSMWVILLINWHMNANKLICTTIWWICNVNVWGWIPQEFAQIGDFRP